MSRAANSETARRSPHAMLAGMRSRLGVVRTVLRSAPLRRVELWVARIVTACARAGPSEVDPVAFVELDPTFGRAGPR